MQDSSGYEHGWGVGGVLPTATLLSSHQSCPLRSGFRVQRIENMALSHHQPSPVWLCILPYCLGV